jgi:two-component system, NarL family, response regulator LiaR
MMSYIFISYSTKDSEYAYRLANKLNEQGYDVWIDKNRLRNGDEWWEMIVKAIAGCAVFVVVMSSDAKQSKWVQREVALADNSEKPIFPLLLDGENWEKLVLIQFQDVRSGKLPPQGFFNNLSHKVPRQQKGTDITMHQIVQEKENAEIAADISFLPYIAQEYQFLNRSRIRVLIVDDHEDVRQGLRVSLENFTDFEIVGATGDARNVVELCLICQPDVVLMDIVMPLMDGVTAIKLLRDKRPDIRVIALTSFDSDENVQLALRAGAISYLMKNVSVEELAIAIRHAYEGKTFLSPEAIQSLIQAVTRLPTLGHDLTEGERQVLALMIEGLNNREIAQQLVISSSTVKNHVSNILDKLGTVSRTQAVALAVEHKMLR